MWVVQIDINMLKCATKKDGLFTAYIICGGIRR